MYRLIIIFFLVVINICVFQRNTKIRWSVNKALNIIEDKYVLYVTQSPFIADLSKYEQDLLYLMGRLKSGDKISPLLEKNNINIGIDLDSLAKLPDNIREIEVLKSIQSMEGIQCFGLFGTPAIALLERRVVNDEHIIVKTLEQPVFRGIFEINGKAQYRDMQQNGISMDEIELVSDSIAIIHNFKDSIVIKIDSEPWCYYN